MKQKTWSFSSYLGEEYPHGHQLIDSTNSHIAKNSNSEPITSSRILSCLIILNQPIPFSPAQFKRLWNNCQIKICADGGANRLRDFVIASFGNKEEWGLENGNDTLDRFLPDIVIGDLDSLRPDVETYYTNKNVPIRKVHCQDTTDLEKSMAYFTETYRPTEQKPVLFILGALTGRFDQIMSTVNFVHKLPDQQVYLVSNDSIAFLCDPDHDHVILVNKRVEGPSCGLIPFGTTQAKCKTKGLKWNLDMEMETGFGGLISTSNLIEETNESIENGWARVEVVTKDPLVWTIEVDLLGDEDVNEGGMDQRSSSVGNLSDRSFSSNSLSSSLS